MRWSILATSSTWKSARPSGRRAEVPTACRPKSFNLVCDAMHEAGLRLCGDPDAAARLHALRALYEPHAQALGNYLGMSLPGWIPEARAKDQWKMVEAVRSQAASVFNQKDVVVSDQAIAVRMKSGDH